MLNDAACARVHTQNEVIFTLSDAAAACPPHTYTHWFYDYTRSPANEAHSAE